MPKQVTKDEGKTVVGYAATEGEKKQSNPQYTSVIETQDVVLNDAEQDVGVVDDPVEHPRHYCSHPAGIEVYQITQHYPENVGAALRYLLRYHMKGAPVEDIRKAIKHLEFEVDRIREFGEDVCLPPWGRK